MRTLSSGRNAVELQPTQQGAIPWRCVKLENQQIVPWMLPNGDLHPNSLNEDELEDPDTLEHHHFCVHVDESARCTLDEEIGDDNGEPASNFVISNDRYIYKKIQLDRWLRMGHRTNIRTMEDFSPEVQYWIRFSSKNFLPSKLDPQRQFDFSHPLIATFQSGQQHVIFTEFMDGHGCGQLKIYTFDGTSQGEKTPPCIESRVIDGIAYASLDQWLLVSDYFDLSVEQLQATIQETTPQQLRKLDREVNQDRQALNTGKLVYQSRNKSAFFLNFNPLVFFSKIRRYNERTWVLSVLARSGILSHLQASLRYEIRARNRFNGSLFNEANSRAQLSESDKKSSSYGCHQLLFHSLRKDPDALVDMICGGGNSPTPRATP